METGGLFGGTDCHVAALLAMTGEETIPSEPSGVAVNARVGDETDTGGTPDCHVAALLAMTKRNDTVCKDDTENAQRCGG